MVAGVTAKFTLSTAMVIGECRIYAPVSTAMVIGECRIYVSLNSDGDW
jgi:hypothetical protein